ncbi:glycosyltransferase [Citrifermentans bemidjiense Bem]|uniref:Glycosyltransferase n=1 Tax=Citrifermentans bemidjiense (strain ATCC BAA-1014 / DSM 16622 / JCM 12645 / Bem) TaxID=404380 RepID=B5E8P9_CITBB|nr:glycosyltransferase family 2 protein [Citrifermentans bemidjiense]ACH38634.1 glycosyltransferase [Citrifermentans bemidjiense Bem]
MTNRPLITVCIPAYNRAHVLEALLDSILCQSFDDFEVLICEDGSPEREAIRSIARRYAESSIIPVRYQENVRNLGYDGNLRNLIEQANGQYCFFMGNDDLMCPGALSKVASAVSRYEEVGVVLRTYAAFDGEPENVVQTFRYFDRELFFPAGSRTISTIYRRAVVIPGLVIHRDAARSWSTDRFDGTLLYQLYLVANILADMNAVYLPDVTVLYRNGGTPDFGNSAAERNKFQPKEQTPESSVHFMKGMLEIARFVEQQRRIPIYNFILRDIANYCYPILAIQAQRPLPVFLNYAVSLGRLGFARHPMFHLWFLALLLLGSRRSAIIICWIKEKLGRTPTIGTVYQGEVR